MTCPKCKGEMEEGYQYVDVAGGVHAKEGTYWARKDTVTSLMGAPKDRIRITEYRCKNCGYLENYAK